MAYKSGGNEVVEGDVYNESGTKILESTAGSALADISTADGTDAATTQALANATKAKVNALLAILRAKQFPS